MLLKSKDTHRTNSLLLTISRRFLRQSRLETYDQSRLIQSDFANQPFTGVYEPGQPTNGPLGNIPLIGRTGPTPKTLKHHLDQFVVGQNKAKKTVSTAVFNHYQRILESRRQEEENQRLFQQRLRRERARSYPLEDEFLGQQEVVSGSPIEEIDHGEARNAPALVLEKSNILLLGPSGVGKTLMAKTLARVLEVPFSISDCTAFTQAGYVGEDAQVCVERLLAAADYDIEAAECGIIVLDEVDKIAAQKGTHGRDVGGEGVQQALLKIIEGTTLNVQVKTGSNKGSHRGNIGHDQAASVTQNFNDRYTSSQSSGTSLGGVAGANKHEILTVKTDKILFILTGAFIGLEKHVLSRIHKGSIGFGTQIKSSGWTESSSEMLSPSSILERTRIFKKHMPFLSQRELGVTSKYHILDLVDPTDLQAYGMIPELVGRVPVTTALSPLDEDELVRVLTEPRNNIVKQYEQLFSLSGIELKFTSEALQEVAKYALRMTTGARALRTCIEGLLSEAMFETPGSSVKYVLITGNVARGREPPIYLARGQQHKFQSMLASEEDAFATTSRYNLESSKAKKDQGKEPRLQDLEEYRARNATAGYS